MQLHGADLGSADSSQSAPASPTGYWSRADQVQSDPVTLLIQTPETWEFGNFPGWPGWNILLDPRGDTAKRYHDAWEQMKKGGMFVSKHFSWTNAFKDIFLTMRNFCFELGHVACSYSIPGVLLIGGFLQNLWFSAKTPTEMTSWESLSTSARLVEAYFWKSN